MAKTYEELKEMGWVEGHGFMTGSWYHKKAPTNPTPTFERQAGEADAEFRERLERNTPGLRDFDYVTALRRAKNKRTRLQYELQRLEAEIEPLTQKVRETSLWDVISGQPPMTWEEMMGWATESREIWEIKIAQHDYRVEFFGLKSRGRPLLYVASRVGWPQDMEGDDE